MNKYKSLNEQIMKMKFQSLSWLLILLLSLGEIESWAQGPYANTGNETVCLNSTQQYGVIDVPTSTYAWSITPAIGGTITSSGHNTISILWQTAGIYTLSVIETNNSGCSAPIASIQVTVGLANTIALSSAAGTNNQTISLTSPITNITYSTTGATGATFTGLPAGVTGNWAANVITISGTPSTSGSYNYTVTLTGGCGTATATGTIIVTLANTITLTSAANTVNQSVCINTAITNITYSTLGATGATFAGLPTGVTGIWAANMVTISGTPTVSGPFNYTITLTGGNGIATSAGTIQVNQLPATSPIYHN
jgi:hypothetical protein